jgi:hypothetical protein
MSAGHTILLTPSSVCGRPLWSYRYTGTLPQLISLVSHTYENIGGVAVFFPFWYRTRRAANGNSQHYSTSFFSHSCALFCTHQKHNSFLFKGFRTLRPKTPGWGYLLWPPSTSGRSDLWTLQDVNPSENRCPAWILAGPPFTCRAAPGAWYSPGTDRRTRSFHPNLCQERAAAAQKVVCAT